MEKDAKGRTSNEKHTSKKNSLNYNDEIITAPSTPIAIKKVKVAPTNMRSQRKKTAKIDNLHEVYK